VRNLGTPVFPKAYFAHLLDTFGDACRILTVRHGSEPIASVMSLLFRNEILPYYGGGSLDARRLAANDFMYWELMKCASEWGCTLFDFGRSKKGTGSYAFKKNWGFVPEPLFYEYRLFGTEVLPQVNPLNPRYQLMIAIWKRLPLALANIVGPWISRNLG
jgi:FemAB-related protein (PEP-CTERM system-associated)